MRRIASTPGKLIWQLSLVFGCLLAVALVMVACSSRSNTPSASGMAKLPSPSATPRHASLPAADLFNRSSSPSLTCKPT